MALYSIKQETLTGIGDALRRKWGETHEELKYENYAVCKTDGSTGFDIPSRLTKEDREYLEAIVRIVYDNWINQGIK